MFEYIANSAIKSIITVIAVLIIIYIAIGVGLGLLIKSFIC